ncbi:hypothetical protein [Sphingomonas sp. DC1100-1]
MAEKTVITVSGFGCVVLMAFIACAIGGFVGIIIAVAKWIAG